MVRLWCPLRLLAGPGQHQGVRALKAAVEPLMTKGQFGARDLHKRLWKLPIPQFNPSQELHTIIAEAGVTAAAAAGKKLAELRQERGDRLTVGIVRRE